MYIVEPIRLDETVGTTYNAADDLNDLNDDTGDLWHDLDT